MKKSFRIFLIAAFVALASVPAAAYELYFGDLHSHTSFSDGKGLPENAFDMARTDAKLDYWTVSDHVEQLTDRMDLPEGAPKQTEWDALKAAAAAKTEDGKFVALAGFEWAMEWNQGHLNVINTDDYAVFQNGYPLKNMYRWITKHPDAVFGFNHPSNKADQMKVFDHFKYVPSVASQAVYVATNKSADFPYYYMALDNGWRVAPSAQQDNHTTNWGMQASGNLTAVYADELTTNSLLDAFRARRFYATNDRALQLDFTAGGAPMGSVLDADGADVRITVKHTGGTPISSVKLISNRGEVVREWTPNAPEFSEKVAVKANPGESAWFVVLAEGPKGRFSISAPIWLKKN